MALKDKRGYRKVWYEGKMVWEHRLVWFLEHGEWPEVIHHKNGDKSDNRLENLQNVDKSYNNYARPVRADSCTGVKGVHPNGKGYMAKLKRKYLGTWPTVEEAKEAYDKAAARLEEEYV